VAGLKVRRYFNDRVRTGFDFDTRRLDVSSRKYTALGWRLFRLQTASEVILIGIPGHSSCPLLCPCRRRGREIAGRCIIDAPDGGTGTTGGSAVARTGEEKGI
jgi:hypothetical protein